MHIASSIETHKITDMLTLNEKVAFVTGGTRGMGLAIVNRLSAEGATVAFTYVRSDEKAQEIVARISKNGRKVLAIKADGAIKNVVANAIEQAAKPLER